MWRTYLFGLLILMNLPDPCVAQSADQHERAAIQQEKPASEARSFMGLFTKLERDWIQAEQAKDQTKLDAILAPEFTLRSSEQPESSQSRADWIQQALTKYEIRSFDHRAMVIRAFLGVAVVSFIQTQQATIEGKDCSGDYLIVDVWEANHGKWQVSTRYIAPVTARKIGSPNVQR
jgi:hypothetical protein